MGPNWNKTVSSFIVSRCLSLLFIVVLLAVGEMCLITILVVSSCKSSCARSFIMLQS